MKDKTTLAQLNQMDRDAFVAVCGSLFENSPWIASRTWERRPFAGLDALHAALMATVTMATRQEQIGLIRAHPDLIGRMARQGQLTQESTAEQTAAGLVQLCDAEIATFDRYNAEYRKKFGFPFVICARENKKDAILASFPVRLKNDKETEITAALAEIAKIARLRLFDAVSET